MSCMLFCTDSFSSYQPCSKFLNNFFSACYELKYDSVPVNGKSFYIENRMRNVVAYQSALSWYPVSIDQHRWSMVLNCSHDKSLLRVVIDSTYAIYIQCAPIAQSHLMDSMMWCVQCAFDRYMCLYIWETTARFYPKCNWLHVTYYRIYANKPHSSVRTCLVDGVWWYIYYVIVSNLLFNGKYWNGNRQHVLSDQLKWRLINI